PGLTVVGLAVWAGLKASATSPRAGLEPCATFVDRDPTSRDRGPERAALLVILAIASGITAALLLGASIRLSGVKLTSFPRALLFTAAIWIGGIAISKPLRRWLLDRSRGPLGFFGATTKLAIVMSFGPAIFAGGREVASTNLYSFFYRLVPGVDG